MAFQSVISNPTWLIGTQRFISNGDKEEQQWPITTALQGKVGKQVWELKSGLRITFYPSKGDADFECVHCGLEMEMNDSTGLKCQVTGAGNSMGGVKLDTLTIAGRNGVTKAQFTLNKGVLVEKPYTPPKDYKAPSPVGITNMFF